MAGVLSCCGAWNASCVISFLIVAADELCDKIFEVIKSGTKSRKYRTAVHKCESISDILRSRTDLHVDYIVFAFDGRLTHLVNEVETNINLLDEFYIISGRICLVNCYDSSNSMGLICHAANRLRDKYCIHLLSVNINSSESRKNLAKRILNLSEALIGVNSGIPDINMLAEL